MENQKIASPTSTPESKGHSVPLIDILEALSSPATQPVFAIGGKLARYLRELPEEIVNPAGKAITGIVEYEKVIDITTVAIPEGQPISARVPLVALKPIPMTESYWADPRYVPVYFRSAGGTIKCVYVDSPEYAFFKGGGDPIKLDIYMKDPYFSLDNLFKLARELRYPFTTIQEYLLNIRLNGSNDARKYYALALLTGMDFEMVAARARVAYERKTRDFDLIIEPSAANVWFLRPKPTAGVMRMEELTGNRLSGIQNIEILNTAHQVRDFFFRDEAHPFPGGLVVAYLPDSIRARTSCNSNSNLWMMGLIAYTGEDLTTQNALRAHILEETTHEVIRQEFGVCHSLALTEGMPYLTRAEFGVLPIANTLQGLLVIKRMLLEGELPTSHLSISKYYQSEYIQPQTAEEAYQMFAYPLGEVLVRTILSRYSMTTLLKLYGSISEVNIVNSINNGESIPGVVVISGLSYYVEDEEALFKWGCEKAGINIASLQKTARNVVQKIIDKELLFNSRNLI